MMRTAEDNHKKEEFNEVEWSVDHSPHVSSSFYSQLFCQGFSGYDCWFWGIF